MPTFELTADAETARVGAADAHSLSLIGLTPKPPPMLPMPTLPFELNKPVLPVPRLTGLVLAVPS